MNFLTLKRFMLTHLSKSICIMKLIKLMRNTLNTLKNKSLTRACFFFNHQPRSHYEEPE
jgi:hypothetical protein